MKFCSGCNTSKPLGAFYARSLSVDGLAARCKDCSKAYLREWHAGARKARQDALRSLRSGCSSANSRAARLYRYGLSKAEYEEKLAMSNGACWVCGDFDVRLCIDHDPAAGAGAVRGLLCGRCNSGLGFFRDDPGLLRIALAYLAYFGKT